MSERFTFQSFVEDGLERLVKALIDTAMEEEQNRNEINKKGRAYTEGVVYRHIYEHSEKKLKELVEYQRRKRNFF